MSDNDSVKGWITLFAILVGTTLVAAIWPLLSGAISLSGGGGAPDVPVPTVMLPVEIAGVSELNGLLALGILAAVVVGLVAGAGAVLGFAYVFLNRQAEAIQASDTFQAHQTALAQLEKAQVDRLREGRSTHPVPEHKMPRWSAISTSLIVLLFTVVGGMIVASAVIPAGAMWMPGGEDGLVIIGARTAVILALLLLATAILAWRMRPARLDAIEATNDGPVPWDSIWVIITGLLVVGLGVGVVVYLNIPG